MEFVFNDIVVPIYDIYQNNKKITNIPPISELLE